MKRVPRLLLLAFALSLIVHLIVAVMLRPPAPTTANQAEVVSIEHRPATIAVRKMVTPPPPPQHTPSPRVVSSARPRSSKGTAPAARSGGGPPVAQTPLAALPTPSPLARPSAACTQPNADPALAVEPSPPDIAPAARTAGTNGIALVRVLLDASGQVTNAGVTQSTGNSSLDLVAATMARDARYTPALHDCKPIAGAYTFSVKFVAW